VDGAKTSEEEGKAAEASRADGAKAEEVAEQAALEKTAEEPGDEAAEILKKSEDPEFDKQLLELFDVSMSTKSVTDPNALLCDQT